MLIINYAGAALASVFNSAFWAGCRLVVIRIAAYRKRFSNRFGVYFDCSNSFRQSHLNAAAVALP
jgi:hypothetical protein